MENNYKHMFLKLSIVLLIEISLGSSTCSDNMYRLFYATPRTAKRKR